MSYAEEGWGLGNTKELTWFYRVEFAGSIMNGLDETRNCVPSRLGSLQSRYYSGAENTISMHKKTEWKITLLNPPAHYDRRVPVLGGYINLYGGFETIVGTAVNSE